MAAKLSKATTAPELVAQSIAPSLDIEDMIAHQLLDDIDWQKVSAALIRQAPAKLFAWLQSQILPIDGSVPIIVNEIEAMAICEGDSNA